MLYLDNVILILIIIIYFLKVSVHSCQKVIYRLYNTHCTIFKLVKYIISMRKKNSYVLTIIILGSQRVWCANFKYNYWLSKEETNATKIEYQKKYCTKDFENVNLVQSFFLCYGKI